MSEIEAEIASRRYATACQKLERLAASSADRHGEIAYLLGYCERARGRDDAAQAAWARVAPGSRFARQALEGRMRLFEESGRLAEAERIVNEAASDPRNDRTAMLVLLVPTFREQGRIEEAARLIENRWEHLRALNEGALEPAIRLVRRHIELTLKPESIESLRPALEQASARAPEDDRVWLGLANLAIRTGALDEAKRWLLACRSRRPDDAAVWQALLSWGLAAAPLWLGSGRFLR
jgi:thioredoxin-like negative regulator of GroEL